MFKSHSLTSVANKGSELSRMLKRERLVEAALKVHRFTSAQRRQVGIITNTRTRESFMVCEETNAFMFVLFIILIRANLLSEQQT